MQKRFAIDLRLILLAGLSFLVLAVKKKQYIRGFEQGGIFNGCSFVCPVSMDDEHLGSVEISVSMNSVIEEFRKREQTLDELPRA